MVQRGARNLAGLLGATAALLALHGTRATVDAAPVSPASVPSVALGVPQLAKVDADATGVGLAWWAVKGAVQYQVLRASDPQGTATVSGTLQAGTLGFRDPLPANPAAWFQLVAIGADGARSPGVWTLVNTPSVAGIVIGPTGALITWTTVKPAPAGYEIWRSADPKQPAARVGSVASGTTTFTDPKPLAGTSYYEVVALGGGARAASLWTAAGAAAAAPVSRASLGLPVPQVASPATSGLNAAASATPGTPALSVPAPGAGTGTPKLGAPATATTPAAKTLTTNVPPVTGIWAMSTNAAAHTLFWSCVNELGCNPDVPAPSYTYEVWIKDPAATGFTLLSSSVQLVHGCPDPNLASCGPATTIKLDMTRFLTPQTAFRVVRKDQATGLQSTGDFVYAAPAQPVQPTGFTATEPQYGQVAMTWQAVPGAVDYLLYEKTVNAPPTRVAGTSTTWKTVSAGTHTYQVATEYSPGFRNTNMPEASVLVHMTPPSRSGAYLTRNNGAGSQALAQLHQAANGEGIGGALQDVAFHRGLLTGWDVNGNLTWSTPLSLAWYGNATELGFARSVGCWQWPNHVGTLTVGMVTFCLAGNHGTPPGTQLPDSASLAANTAGIADTYGLIVTSPTAGQFFANFGNGRGNPLQTDGLLEWARGWTSVPTTTLDSEGPKYTPNACLACHGGTVNPATGKVSGASLLPIDPGLVVFPGNRAAEEESIRQINAMIAASMPSAAISDYINGLYNGKVSVAGSTAQANYVPASWSQQAQLFQAVVKSDCLMCHLATPAARSFGSAAGFMQNKAAIYADVCNAHSMPNAEVPYVRFWTSTGALGGTSVNLAGYMMAILGYNSCP